MKNKERVNDWLDDIKNEVDRIGAYDLDDHIQALKQMIDSQHLYIAHWLVDSNHFEMISRKS